MSRRTDLVELRRYTLHAGQREALISLFESFLVTPQEEAGMSVLGQFRDLDRPDQFVWLRGFGDDPDERGRALRAFYGGPVWARHRDAANATMIDSDDVLLLRPVPGGAFGRPAPAERPVGLFVATIYVADDLHELTASMTAVEPLLASLGSERLAGCASADVPNTFPALPVRDDLRAYVRIARYASEDAHAAHRERLEDAARSDGRLRALRARVSDELRLVPTDRSALR